MTEQKGIQLNVRSQKAYNSLTTQLAEAGYLWASDRYPTDLDFWYENGRETVITVMPEFGRIVYGTTESRTDEELKTVKLFKPSDKLISYLA